MTETVIRGIPEEWAQEAKEQDISLAEYCRRMARAGRRQFGYDYASPEEVPEVKTLKNEEGSASQVDEELKRWIYTNLSVDEAQNIDELLELLEDDLLQLADELQEDGRAKYLPSQGGYLKVKRDE